MLVPIDEHRFAFVFVVGREASKSVFPTHTMSEIIEDSANLVTAGCVCVCVYVLVRFVLTI